MFYCSLTVKELWEGWYVGNAFLKTPPYKDFKHNDTNFSKAKKIMLELDKIAGEKGLTPVTMVNSDAVFSVVFSTFREKQTFKKGSNKINCYQSYNTIYNLWMSK